MKKILCYGDSNTFGYNPKDGSRFGEKIRFSGILKEKLKNFEIIEKGLNNRTAFCENSISSEHCAKKHLPFLYKYDIITMYVMKRE